MSNDVDGGAGSGDAAVEERVVSFLWSADRPRQVASEVAVALDLTRGQVRTGLQTLADEGRVVRADEGTTARWAVPDRADEPDATPDAGRDGPTGTDDGGTETDDGDTIRTDDGATGESPGPDPAADSARMFRPESGDGDATGGSFEGPVGDGPMAEERASDAATSHSWGGERRRGHRVVRVVTVVLGLAVAGAVLRRLRRTR